MKRMCVVVSAVFFGLLFLPLFAEETARVWRTKVGGELEAVWDRGTDSGDSIVLVKDGKKYQVKLADLSDADVKYVEDARQAGGAPAGFTLMGDETAAPAAPAVPAAAPAVPAAPAAAPADAANATQAGEAKTLTLKGVSYTFRWCPAGSFTMGSPATEADHDEDEAQHQVTLSQGFWMMETEVTREMWKSLMFANPISFGENRPVAGVSWNSCQEFIAKLNSDPGMPAGYRVSLPTEAQWEYACRAGSTGAFGGTGNLDEMGWYELNSGNASHDVKTKRPNAWGLYDMHGNVAEWCSDWHSEYYYSNSPATDPKGPETGTERVYRGGSWDDDGEDCRSAHRSDEEPTDSDNELGFRLILVPAM